MKFSRKTTILIWVLALLPLAATAVLYRRLPEQIPGQWGLDGSVRYDPKATIWGIALLSPLFAFLIPLMARVDPRRKNYQKFSGTYQGFLVVLMLFLAAMNGIILSESLHPGRINVAKVVTIGCGLLFAWLGNVMPKIRSNFFFGIKTPWTLSDPRVWERTHRLGGYCFFAGGILTVLLALLLQQRILFYGFFALMMAICLIPTIMSCIWYRRLSGKGTDKS